MFTLIVGPVQSLDELLQSWVTELEGRIKVIVAVALIIPTPHSNLARRPVIGKDHSVLIRNVLSLKVIILYVHTSIVNRGHIFNVLALRDHLIAEYLVGA